MDLPRNVVVGATSAHENLPPFPSQLLRGEKNDLSEQSAPYR